jgi:serine/threonine protein kinase
MFSPRSLSFKLIDFDLAVYSDINGEYCHEEVVGTAGFIAPEARTSNKYSFASDVYSLGKVYVSELREDVEGSPELYGDEIALKIGLKLSNLVYLLLVKDCFERMNSFDRSQAVLRRLFVTCYDHLVGDEKYFKTSHDVSACLYRKICLP